MKKLISIALFFLYTFVSFGASRQDKVLKGLSDKEFEAFNLYLNLIRDKKVKDETPTERVSKLIRLYYEALEIEEIAQNNQKLEAVGVRKSSVSILRIGIAIELQNTIVANAGKKDFFSLSSSQEDTVRKAFSEQEFKAFNLYLGLIGDKKIKHESPTQRVSELTYLHYKALYLEGIVRGNKKLADIGISTSSVSFLRIGFARELRDLVLAHINEKDFFIAGAYKNLHKEGVETFSFGEPDEMINYLKMYVFGASPEVKVDLSLYEVRFKAPIEKIKEMCNSEASPFLQRLNACNALSKFAGFANNPLVQK